MDRPLRLASGLRPAARYALILGIYVLLTVAALITLLIAHRASATVNVLPLAFMFSIWLLGVLTILIDRPGPVRNWAAPLVVSLCAPYVALWYDWEIALKWARSGVPPMWTTLLLLNTIVLGGYGVYLSRAYPQRCPKCHSRSLIPLFRLTRIEKRTARTRWCASCNEKLWKDQNGTWQKERRKTWVDDIEPVNEGSGVA